MATFSLAGEPFELISTSKWTFAEARAFEKATGFTFLDLRMDQQIRKSAATEQAMLWISIKRVKPETKFSDLDSLAYGDIEWQDDEDEQATEAAEPNEEAEAEERPTEGEDSQPNG